VREEGKRDSTGRESGNGERMWEKGPAWGGQGGRNGESRGEGSKPHQRDNANDPCLFSLSMIHCALRIAVDDGPQMCVLN
jgi:hypothetical protein